MELVILVAGLAGVVFLAKFGMMYLRNIKAETGYNPTGILNSLLITGIFAFPVGGMLLMENTGSELGMLVGLGAVGCLLGLIMRNLVLKKPVKIILVTFFQIVAPALTLLGILYKRSGGIMGNAVTRANLGGTSAGVSHAVSKQSSARDYTSGQDQLARSYGFANAEEAAKNGMNMKTML